MTIESIGAGSTIASLDPTNPTSTDNISEGDDHIRNTKLAVVQTFMNLSATVSSVAAELDFAHKGGTVSGNATILGTLTVSSSAVMKTSLNVAGNTTLSGATVMKTSLTIEGTSTFSATVVTKTAIINEGPTTCGSTLTVSGASVLNGTLSVSGAVSAAGAMTVSGHLSASSAQITSNLTVGGGTKIEGNLTVSGSSNFKATLGVAGETSLGAKTFVGGALTVSGATHLNSTLSVGGAATLASTLTVGGNAVVKGTLTVSSSAVIAGAVIPPKRLTPVAFNASTLMQLTHGLSRIPYMVDVRLVCISATGGFAVNDEVKPFWNDNTSGSPIYTITVDGTSVDVKGNGTNVQVRSPSGTQVNVIPGHFNITAYVI